MKGIPLFGLPLSTDGNLYNSYGITWLLSGPPREAKSPEITGGLSLSEKEAPLQPNLTTRSDWKPSKGRFVFWDWSGSSRMNEDSCKVSDERYVSRLGASR